MTELNNKIENNQNDLSPETPEPLREKNGTVNESKFFDCTECSSLIELLSINEDSNIIEFRCLNKDCHNAKKTMSIKEFFKKMEKNKKTSINEDKCREHISCKNNKYVSYCFDCKCHLCEECLKTRAHICHNKNNIIEIKPIKEELNIIEEVINHYKNNIDNLKNEKINKKKELENLLNQEKINEDKKIKNKIEINDQNKDIELKLNHDKYISDIEEIKKKLKDRENKYKQDEYKINNKYKIMNEKEINIHKLEMDKLSKKYKDIFENLKYDEKIENMINIKKINEVVYNTYNSHNDHYYNSMNINNILLSYFKNDYINNNIIKRVLNNKYEDIFKIVFKKTDEENKMKIKKENEKVIEKEKNELKIKEIKEIKEEFEKKIKEIKEINEEKERLEKKLRKELEEIKEKISYKYLIFINIFYN